MRFYYDPLSEFDSLFDDALTSRFLRPITAPTQASETRRELFRPKYVVNSPCPVVPPLVDIDGCRMDVHENVEDNTVTAMFDLPGVERDQINIDVNQDRLTVSGETSTSEKRDERGYTVRERSCGKFSRTLMLPQGTNVSVGKILLRPFLV